MSAVHIDFETRSAANLRDAGLDVYANHPSTTPLCLGFAHDDEDVGLWRPDGQGDGLFELHQDIRNGITVYAHNAQFELVIWNTVCVPRLGWPILRVEQVRCTMAMALAMGLPGKLEKLGPALGLTERKDDEGHRIMLLLSQPLPRRKSDPPGIRFSEDPEKFQRLYDYCKQDVRTERAAEKRLVPLSDDEWRIWQLDQRINGRGVAINAGAARRAMVLVEAEKRRLDDRMSTITGGYVGACSQVAALGKWLDFRGVPNDGLAKADVQALIDRPGIPDDAREALRLRQEAAKSSTAKLDAMLEAQGADGRVRYSFQYHGAHTGRWAGRRIQPQNFPRPVKALKKAEIQAEILDAIARGCDARWLDMVYGNPLDVISSALRAFLVAGPGCEFVSADFSNIEGRGLAWLAGEEWKLDAFRAFDRGEGPDIYHLAAARIYNAAVEMIDDERRQIGKVAELALGFGGGVGAFQQMARGYGVTVPDDEADKIKKAWRAEHPAIVAYWADLNSAAVAAVQHGRTFSAGAAGRQVKFKVSGSFLWCLLPSGRCLCYPYPKLHLQLWVRFKREAPEGEEPETMSKSFVGATEESARYLAGKWAAEHGWLIDEFSEPSAIVTYMTEDATTRQWQREAMYGGKFAENVTQAICRDLLAQAMLRVDAPACRIVLHAHDEIVAEISTDAVASFLRQFEADMAQLAAWAAGLPVVAKGWRGKFYRK